MRKRTVTHAAVALAVAGVVAIAGTVVAHAQEPDDDLAKALDTILEDKRLDDSQIGVVVAEAEGNKTIYDHNGNMRAIPASNNKILTSAAAMDALGGDYRFDTDLASKAKPHNGSLRGDLYLRGTGDPTMLAADYEKLAAKLAKAGVKKVRGDLVADDTAYDDVRLGTEWGWEDEPYYYAAQTSALTVAPDEDYDAGSVIVNVDPGAAEGDKAKVTLTPPTGYVEVDNTAKTGGETDLTVDRKHGTNIITVSGTIAVGDETTSEYMSVNEPTGYAADIFARALKAKGIKLTGDIRLGETTPSGAKTLAERQSMPLSELLIPFMKLSNNMHAETLVKAMGREKTGEQGSWDNGLPVVKSFLDKQGLSTSRLRQADGSGMSRWNLIPPDQFTTLLSKLRDAKWFDTWYKSMPIACEPDRLVGGTLRSRMCDTPAEKNVYAKTGSLTSVTALSGYVTDADGRELVFSIVTNDYLTGVKDIEDKIAVTLASYSQGESLDKDGVKVPQPEKEAPSGLECSWVKPIAC
ncbi:D-alanyl-D-alanine carboxypeptidase/D-alanyl-D-alanine endopeptidase [Stackebrandtia nassauensis]|uniref:D-alanyl-D-alaninecarboxypeptidase/ D-alanyl-D-alanine-endopeptidase n=1 Tax=Stackebrandtia nassauensis (strain DSM 44728 / CIP 108903 / NRRL B-16338 / NBRC 102104 / LLR-40K-21) TaxID=446470 RepID=D3PV40_STANL|nr:D-alanyl-D-alanine carboxypeptidase/D-alanyl-D-alanine-endopeptidase [Stackebrandtia nassauensis]ADD41093.1 D-alanyl-D-alaninecarboxypeptidase/ D-alanyl-D-alanine-endopeptidase [Stackebrandtia nassauensis DSM 44728]